MSRETKYLYTLSYGLVFVTVVTGYEHSLQLWRCSIRTKNHRDLILICSCSLIEPPKIHSAFPAHQLVNETDTFEIFCNATGNPPPLVTWTKIGDNNKVYPTRKSLRVQHAEKSDFGTYQCTAESVRGENVSAIATVEVDNCKLTLCIITFSYSFLTCDNSLSLNFRLWIIFGVKLKYNCSQNRDWVIQQESFAVVWNRFFFKVNAATAFPCHWLVLVASIESQKYWIVFFCIAPWTDFSFTSCSTFLLKTVVLYILMYFNCYLQSHQLSTTVHKISPLWKKTKGM